jgi:hypothetical protein
VGRALATCQGAVVAADAVADHAHVGRGGAADTALHARPLTGAQTGCALNGRAGIAWLNVAR